MMKRIAVTRFTFFFRFLLIFIEDITESFSELNVTNATLISKKDAMETTTQLETTPYFYSPSGTSPTESINSTGINSSTPGFYSTGSVSSTENIVPNTTTRKEKDNSSNSTVYSTASLFSYSINSSKTTVLPTSTALQNTTVKKNFSSTEVPSTSNSSPPTINSSKTATQTVSTIFSSLPSTTIVSSSNNILATKKSTSKTTEHSTSGIPSTTNILTVQTDISTANTQPSTISPSSTKSEKGEQEKFSISEITLSGMLIGMLFIVIGIGIWFLKRMSRRCTRCQRKEFTYPGSISHSDIQLRKIYSESVSPRYHDSMFEETSIKFKRSKKPRVSRKFIQSQEMRKDEFKTLPSECKAYDSIHIYNKMRPKTYYSNTYEDVQDYHVKTSIQVNTDSENSSSIWNRKLEQLKKTNDKKQHEFSTQEMYDTKSFSTFKNVLNDKSK